MTSASLETIAPVNATPAAGSVVCYFYFLSIFCVCVVSLNVKPKTEKSVCFGSKLCR